MSDVQMERALSPRQEFDLQLAEQVQNFRALLPSHIPVEKFKRVVVVAIAQTPALFRADRRSLFMAAQKCAADGLLPDGRQAALVIYGDQVQYIPMIAGIRQRMRNSGEVLSAEAHVVYRGDKFFQRLGDDAAIVHEPPAFGVDRGDAVGAYAIIKLKNGEILREVMDKHQIEKVRAASKAKNGPAWTGWWDEMARKTVMRRCAKAAPTSADIDEMIGRDDDDQGGESMVNITPPAPEPPRASAITHEREPQETEDPPFVVVDYAGAEAFCNDADEAARLLSDVLDEAQRLGNGHLAAARENNAALLTELRERHPDAWATHIDSFGLSPIVDAPRQPQAPKVATAEPAGEPPRARDEAWWNQEQVAIAVKTSREFQAALHQRLLECRNWAEVERLRDDNQMIDTLDKATKQDVLGALADRERELRATA